MRSDADPTENSTRPPKSSWRTWTEQERAISSALDQEDASDLAAHIFNAHFQSHGDHRLRVAERGRLSLILENAKGLKKKHEESTEKNDTKAEELIKLIEPWLRRGDLWTRWPLSPNEVPRDTESEFRMDNEGTVKESDLSTAQRLIEGLIAQMERQSRPASSSESNDGENLAQKEEEDNGLKLEPLANEDTLRTLLIPSANHITSQIDKVLLGLDQTWNIRYSAKRDFTASLQDTRLKPRDWRDVMAVAAMKGVNSAAVDRAAARCAKLFGESLELTTSNSGVSECRKSYGPEGVSTVIYNGIHGTQSDLDENGLHNDGFLEPIRPAKRLRLYTRRPKDARNDNNVT